MSAPAEYHSIQWYEWLRRAERKQRLGIRLNRQHHPPLPSLTKKETYRTKQKQNNGRQPPNPTNNGTPKNPPRRRNTRILRLLGHMPRRIKPNQHTRRSQVRQTPVPAGRGAGAVVGRHEGFVGGAEAPGVCGADGEPDDVEEEVEEDDERGEVEDPAEDAGCVVCYYCTC